MTSKFERRLSAITNKPRTVEATVGISDEQIKHIRGIYRHIPVDSEERRLLRSSIDAILAGRENMGAGQAQHTDTRDLSNDIRRVRGYFIKNGHGWPADPQIP